MDLNQITEDVSRGALGHWIKIEGGKIKNYQYVVPSTWNLGPSYCKNQKGQVYIDHYQPAQEGIIGCKQNYGDGGYKTEQDIKTDQYQHHCKKFDDGYTSNVFAITKK